MRDHSGDRELLPGTPPHPVHGRHDLRIRGVRAARIVGNMLSFVRKSGDEKRPEDLAVLLDKTVELAANDYDLKKNYDFRQIEIVRVRG